MTLDKPSKSAIEKQMLVRFLLLPAQTAQTVSTTIPRLSKLTVVSILFSNTFQAVKSTEDKVLHLHSFILLLKYDFTQMLKKKELFNIIY